MIDPVFWREAAGAANNHPAFAAKAKHLEALAFTLSIDDTLVPLELHRGALSFLSGPHLRGFRFGIRGPFTEWKGVVSGELPFAKAINVRHGKLRVEGDVVALAWATPALWELFRVTAGRPGVVPHA